MNTSPALRLAVVDDHPIVVAGLQALLAREESVSLAATASTFQNLLDQNLQPFDIILLDLNIPGESYRDNISSIKARFPHTLIAAYTSYNYPDLIRETLKLGCNGYLLKQVSREAMIEGLHAIMAGERYICTELSTPPPPDRARRKQDIIELKDDFQKRLLLSKREKEILHFISKGYTSQHIADELFISRYTVETHRKNILRKLNFNTSTELVKFAVQQGLV